MMRLTNVRPSHGRSSTLAMASAALNGNIDPEMASSVRIAAWLPVRRFIEEHLRDMRLSVEQTALEFGISRATLYRMMVRYGGFANYLRQRRLHRSRDELVDPSKVHFTIAEIAERWGFANASTYSTAFKELFDMTPRDFRQMARGRGHRMKDMGSESDWSRWLAAMR